MLNIPAFNFRKKLQHYVKRANLSMDFDIDLENLHYYTFQEAWYIAWYIVFEER